MYCIYIVNLELYKIVQENTTSAWVHSMIHFLVKHVVQRNEGNAMSTTGEFVPYTEITCDFLLYFKIRRNIINCVSFLLLSL